MRPHSAARTTPRRARTGCTIRPGLPSPPLRRARRSIHFLQHQPPRSRARLRATPRRPASSTAGPRPRPRPRGGCAHRCASSRSVMEGVHHSSLARPPATTAPPTATTHRPEQKRPAGAPLRNTRATSNTAGIIDGKRSRRAPWPVRETPAPPAISGRSQAAPTTATRTSVRHRPVPTPRQQQCDRGPHLQGQQAQVGAAVGRLGRPVQDRDQHQQPGPPRPGTPPAGWPSWQRHHDGDLGTGRRARQGQPPLDGGQAVHQTSQSPARRQARAADAVIADAGPQFLLATRSPRPSPS